jgi:hypothetical protein
MPFKLWCVWIKVVFAMLLVVIVFGFVFSPRPVLAAMVVVAICCVVLLGLTGAVMGIFAAFGRLRMRCPFCGRYGPVGGSKGRGMWMECPSCGLVRTTGPFRLRIVRGKEDGSGG